MPATSRPPPLLLAPGLLVSGAERSLDLGKPELFAAIPTLLFALRTRSLGGSKYTGCCSCQKI